MTDREYMQRALTLAQRGCGWVAPNPLVAGKGVQILKEQGVEVIEGILQEECDAINRIFSIIFRPDSPLLR